MQSEPALDIVGEIMRRYWARVDRLVRIAAQQGMDLAVSSPHLHEGDPGRLHWEHQFLEPGASPMCGTHPEVVFHVYRCGGG